MFGQTGVTATTRSPGSSRACIVTIKADTPELVIDSGGAVERPAMQPLQIRLQGPAQRGGPVVVGVEGATLRQRRHGRLADEKRRRLVAFAEPEGLDVRQAEAGIGYLAHLGGRQGPHPFPRQGRAVIREEGAIVHGAT